MAASKIVLQLFVGFVLVTFGVMICMFAMREPAVCHSVTEDSVIMDCDYHDGGWYRK